MLNTLYEQISKACCYITVFLDEELISEGTGFVFSSNGLVFTAAHVITGRLPIRESDYTDPSLKIYAKFANMPVLEYGVGICCIHIQVNGFRN
ncbi:MAG: serine protease, partial [Burkholderiaceae bacterium]|nr:serine protease [Burkholderiaceae bacterium]